VSVAYATDKAKKMLAAGSIDRNRLQGFCAFQRSAP
jgi:hypothetical protein